MKRWVQARLDALAARAAAGLSLRSGIPLLLFVFALAVSSGIVLRRAGEENREVERTGLENMIQRANRLQAIMETFYRNGLEDSAQAELAGMGTQRGHRLAAVIDEGGRVITSSRSLLLGEQADAALPRIVRNADLLAEGRSLRAQPSGIARLGPGGDTVAVLFPVSFDAGSRSLGKERVGLLFIEYDLAERKAAARAEVGRDALKLTAMMVLLALLMWIFLYAALTRRVRRIVDTVRRVAAADFSARTGIAGRDEIARIAQAFDAMTASLGETRGQLAEALEAAHMYTWTFDAAAQILVFRRPTDRLASRRAGESVPQSVFLERVHPEERAPFEAAWRETLASGAPFHAEYRITDRQGGWRWLATRGSRQQAEGAGPPKLAGLAWDITEAKEAQLELERHRSHLEELVAERTAELRRANQELEAFSYSASHDLQAPLRSIRAFSEIVLAEYGERLDDAGRGHLQRVTRAAGRMSRMVEDLLAFARSGHGELRRVPVDFTALAEEIAAELRSRDPARKSEWHIAADIVAEGDPSLLQSVLANLLGNAWKYSAERNVAAIGFGMREAGGERIYCVRDNGVGFETEQAALIFEPFQRLHSQERFEGSGIGLATVRRIVERHGGRIWAEAAPEGGATFCFTLGG